jgi:hypothetical protein
MRGLDFEELQAMEEILFEPLPEVTDEVLHRLRERGLVSVSIGSCGAHDCIGHLDAVVTPMGSLVLDVVRTLAGVG